MKISYIRERMTDFEPGLMEVAKENAVLIPLVEKSGRTHILFETRSTSVAQPGEVCFPGGRVDKGETPLDAALREFEEEIGIHRERVNIIGKFDTLHLYTQIALHTFLGELAFSDLEAANLSEEEVADIFLVPVEFFAENEPVVYEYRVLPEIREDFPYDLIDAPGKYDWNTGRCAVPIWHYKGRVIWGITARMITHFIDTFFR